MRGSVIQDFRSVSTLQGASDRCFAKLHYEQCLRLFLNEVWILPRDEIMFSRFDRASCSHLNPCSWNQPRL